MKTIKQIADEIGVSKQAIQKRISREPLCTSIQPYISTKQGTKYIDENGESLIKSAFSDKVYTTVADNVHEDKTDTVHTLIAMLQAELEIKNKQIEELNAANKELTSTIKIQAQSINADRHNELAGTMQKQLISNDTPIDDIEPDKPPKKSFFGKLFGK